MTVTSYVAAGAGFDAAKVVSKKSDAPSLRAAATLARLAGESQLAHTLALRCAKGLATSLDWVGAQQVLKAQEVSGTQGVPRTNGVTRPEEVPSTPEVPRTNGVASTQEVTSPEGVPSTQEVPTTQDGMLVGTAHFYSYIILYYTNI